MSFREDCKPYFAGTWPFMKRIPEDTDFDGNAILYTAIYLITLKRLGEWIEEVDRPHLDSLYSKCMVRRGLINRGHDNLSSQAHDDYIGLVAAAYECGALYITRDIYNHGIQNFWIYCNLPNVPWYKKITQYFFARLPGVIQHIKECDWREWSSFDRLWWEFGLWWGTTRHYNEVSGRQLDWLMATAKGKYFYYPFVDNIIKKYPKGKMGEVFAIFFRPDHVFAKYWWGKI